KMVLGTPSYMAPEQVQGHAIDHRVDVYACGVLLFELLTATKPFKAGDPVAICMQHLTLPPPRLAENAPGRAFGPLEDVVARALAKDPAQRFATAAEFSRALVEAGKLLDGTPNPAPLLATVQLRPPKIVTQPSARTADAARPRARSRRNVLVAAIVGTGAVAS